MKTRPRGSALGLACALIVAPACGAPVDDAARAAVTPTYDKASGRLTELAYDSNGNGRADTWTDMDGSRPLRSRLDTDEDGLIDRWEDYDEQGRLRRVGFSRAGNGVADAWGYPGPDGTLERIEISSSADPDRIDRWEYYGAGGRNAGRPAGLVRAEEDTNGDGRPDKWETYEQGTLRSTAFDETGNGRPDRRLTYLPNGRVVVESEPDASGRFGRRTEAG